MNQPSEQDLSRWVRFKHVAEEGLCIPQEGNVIIDAWERCAGNVCREQELVLSCWMEGRNRKRSLGGDWLM